MLKDEHVSGHFPQRYDGDIARIKNVRHILSDMKDFADHLRSDNDMQVDIAHTRGLVLSHKINARQRIIKQ